MTLSMWFQPSFRKQQNASYKHNVVLNENFNHASPFSVAELTNFFILIHANEHTYYQQFEEQQNTKFDESKNQGATWEC